MKEKLEQIAKLLESSEETAAALNKAGTAAQAAEILCRNGVQITEAELRDIAAAMTSDELGEDTLELVAGGCLKKVWEWLLKVAEKIKPPKLYPI